MSESTDLDLLLIGKTGNGKSATGNSILMQKTFKCSGSANSVTKKIKQGFGKYKGRKIKVVDSPGVGDTRMDSARATQTVTEALKKAIMVNPRGYHAFLILIKYGNRFTGEEQDAIKYLKGVFGANFVRDFCILVMSNGDSFKKDTELVDMTFEKWCSQQEGQLKELIAECGNRIVLFDNHAVNTNEKEAQLDRLVLLVDNLNSGGKRYAHELFEEAKETRDKILEEAKENIIREDTLIETSLIFQKLEKIHSTIDGKAALRKLDKLKKRCGKLYKEIPEGKSQAFITLFSSVNSLIRIIDLEICFNEKVSNNQQTEQTRNRHKVDIQNMYSEFRSVITEENNEGRDYKEHEIQKLYDEKIKQIQNEIQSIELGKPIEERRMTFVNRLQIKQEKSMTNEQGRNTYAQGAWRQEEKTKTRSGSIKEKAKFFEKQGSSTQNLNDRVNRVETRKNPPKTTQIISTLHEPQRKQDGTSSDINTCEQMKYQDIKNCDFVNGDNMSLAEIYVTHQEQTKTGRSDHKMDSPVTEISSIIKESKQGSVRNVRGVKSPQHEIFENHLKSVLIRQYREINNEEMARRKLREEQEKEIIQEIDKARELIVDATDKNTETLLSKAFTWITKPIRAVVNWVASKFK